MQRTSCHSIKKSQNKAKRPNIFFKAKQEIKKPKSSYLAAKKPSYQPWLLFFTVGLGIVRIFSSAFYPPSAFSHPRFIIHPHFLIRVLSSIRIFSSAFYPPSAFSHPRFILHPHFLIRIFSSASVSAIRIRIRIRVLSLPRKTCVD